MFKYEIVVDHICGDYVDTDSLSIIKEYSVFYIEEDNDLILKKMKNHILKKNNLDFYYFLLFNLKSLEIFKICQDNISIHYQKNHFINFTLLEDETFNIIKSHFFNENSSKYEINIFINKYFWKHILTDRFEFLNNPHKWDYLENSRIFIKNFLITKMYLDHLEIDIFLDFIVSNFNFTNFHFKEFDSHFKSNLDLLDLSFGHVINSDEEDMLFIN